MRRKLCQASAQDKGKQPFHLIRRPGHHQFDPDIISWTRTSSVRPGLEGDEDEDDSLVDNWGLRSVSPPTWRKWAAHKISFASKNTQGPRKRNFQEAVRTPEATSRKPTQCNGLANQSTSSTNLTARALLDPLRQVPVTQAR